VWALIRRVALLALGFAPGAFAGYAWALVKAETRHESSDLAWRAKSERAYFQYRFEDWETAKCGMMNYIWDMQALARVSQEPQPKVLRSVGLSYARMAVAAQRAGHDDYEKELLKHARKTLERVGEHPTDEALVNLVEEADKEWDREFRECIPAVPGSPATPREMTRPR